MNTTASDPQLRSFRWFHLEALKRQGRLTLKELREILRDRRTIITLVLMPLLLYPLLSIAMQQFFLTEIGAQATPEYSIGFVSARDAELFEQYMNWGEALETPPPDAEAQPKPIIKMFQSEDLREAVRRLDLDLGIRLVGDAPQEIDPRQDLSLQWEIFHCPDFGPSRNALELIRQMLRDSNQAFLRLRLRTLNISQDPEPAQAKVVDVEPIAGVTSGVSLMSVLPLILILMTITGAVYPAIDLTAGERERGTLEILVSAPVSRMSLLFAKYVAVLVVAMLTATVNLATMTVTILVSGMGPLLFGDSGLSPKTVVQVFALLLLFAAFFSSLLLALTSFARSFKEAQAYLIPLMLVSMAPGMMSILPGLELGGVLTVAPLMNIVLLARDLFQNSADPVSAAVVVVSTLLYAAAAIGLAAQVFGSEDVLYGDHGGWSAFWHRPAEPRDLPSVSGAMTCLAAMFPGYFLLNSTVALLGGASISVRLALGAGVTILLFVGVPLLAARMSWIRLRSGFNLRPASVVAFAASVLLGLSLWPIAHEIVVWKIEFGLVNVDHLMSERIEEMLDKIRALPLGVVLLCLAIVPAVCEEFFFRGYLFSALQSQTGPRSTILGSALLFGLFHLVVTDRLAFERFVPSTMMGVTLGWVCWRSASVLPGMLLHATFNGFLLAVSYYKDELADRGIGIEEQSHLPVPWVLTGAAVSAAALFLIEWRGR